MFAHARTLLHILLPPWGHGGKTGAAGARERERVEDARMREGGREERNKEKESHQKFRTEDDATAARD